MHWVSESLYRHDVDALTYSSPLVLGAPHLAAVEGTSAGSSFQYSSAAFIAGLVEYVERRHFMHRVTCARLLSIDAIEQEMPGLAFAYSQVAHGMSIAEVRASSVQTTWALRYRDWEPVLAPRNLVSLTDVRGSIDLSLNPTRDSCGMAGHTTARGAAAGATLEFIERQTWIAAWLGAGTLARIDLRTAPICVGARWGLEDGLECYWLRSGLPAYTIFAVYFGRGTAGEPFFSCGLAASGEPGKSLEKAIAEAHHYRSFAAEKTLQSRQGGFLAGRRLEHNSLRFQVPHARSLMPCLDRIGETVSAQDFYRLPLQSAAHIRAELISRWPGLFIYAGFDASVLGEFYVAKVFSSDFYLHGDPGVELNFDNEFARSLEIDDVAFDRRTSTCLP